MSFDSIDYVLLGFLIGMAFSNLQHFIHRKYLDKVIKHQHELGVRIAENEIKIRTFTALAEQEKRVRKDLDSLVGYDRKSYRAGLRAATTAVQKEFEEIVH